MEDATKKVLKTLSERGYRITNARIHVIGALVHAHAPCTVQALAELVSVDEASVYRTIELLVAEKLVEVIATQDERPKYALSHGHHHHLVCRNCGFIAHVPCEDQPMVPKQVSSFAHIDDHEVTFYGTCRTCV